MKVQKIVLGDDLTVDAEAGEQMSFAGRFSGKTLAGIDVDMKVVEEDVEAVEELLGQRTTRVADPFAGRTYDATVAQRTMSYVSGVPGRTYRLEIREVDEAPRVQELEIEGTVLPVLRYEEHAEGETGVSRHAVVRLSKEQFTSLEDVLDSREPVRVRRVGVDAEALSLAIRSSFWSEHEEERGPYIKQLIRLFPLDRRGLDLGLASREHVIALTTVVIDAIGRVEALLGELAKKNVISDETKTALLGDGWHDVLEKGRLQAIAGEIGNRLDQVDNAEEKL